MKMTGLINSRSIQHLLEDPSNPAHFVGGKAGPHPNKSPTTLPPLVVRRVLNVTCTF